MSEAGGRERGAAPGARRPIHPYLILLAAIVLPGSGQVLAGMPQRGLIMQTFMLMLGWITWNLTMPGQSFLGRASGGLLIYACSILDAYFLGRLRWETWRRPLHQNPPG